MQSDKKSIVHPRHAIYHILDTSCGTGCDSEASKNYRTFPVLSRVTPNFAIFFTVHSNASWCSVFIKLEFKTHLKDPALKLTRNDSLVDFMNYYWVDY